MRRYNSQSADISAHDPLRRVAGMRRLCHHSVILVDHPPPRRLLALAEGFPVSHPDTTVDRNVDRSGRDYGSVARPDVLCHSVDMATRDAPLRRRVVDLQTRWSRFQRRPTRRPAGARLQTWGTAPGNIGHTRAGPPSRVSGTFVRDAGLEPGDGTGGLLWADRVRTGHWRGHDPIGRSGTGAALRRRISRIPANRTGSRAQDMDPLKFDQRRGYNRIS